MGTHERCATMELSAEQWRCLDNDEPMPHDNSSSGVADDLVDFFGGTGAPAQVPSKATKPPSMPGVMIATGTGAASPPLGGPPTLLPALSSATTLPIVTQLMTQRQNTTFSVPFATPLAAPLAPAATMLYNVTPSRPVPPPVPEINPTPKPNTKPWFQIEVVRLKRKLDEMQAERATYIEAQLEPVQRRLETCTADLQQARAQVAAEQRGKKEAIKSAMRKRKNSLSYTYNWPKSNRTRRGHARRRSRRTTTTLWWRKRSAQLGVRPTQLSMRLTKLKASSSVRLHS